MRANVDFVSTSRFGRKSVKVHNVYVYVYVHVYVYVYVHVYVYVCRSVRITVQV